MRRIDRTGQFKRDFKRESKGRHRNTLGTDLPETLMLFWQTTKHYQSDTGTILFLEIGPTIGIATSSLILC